METSFTYLKSGCLYTLQYSFFEVFLLLLSKKQSELLTLTPKICAKNTHKKLFGHTLYSSKGSEEATQQTRSFANSHNAILRHILP